MRKIRLSEYFIYVSIFCISLIYSVVILSIGKGGMLCCVISFCLLLSSFYCNESKSKLATLISCLASVCYGIFILLIIILVIAINISFDVYFIVWISMTTAGVILFIKNKSRITVFKISLIVFCILLGTVLISIACKIALGARSNISNITNAPDAINLPIWDSFYVDIPFGGWLVIKKDNQYFFFSIDKYVNNKYDVHFCWHVLSGDKELCKIQSSGEGIIVWNKIFVNKVSNGIFNLKILPPNKIIYEDCYTYGYVDNFMKDDLLSNINNIIWQKEKIKGNNVENVPVNATAISPEKQSKNDLPPTDPVGVQRVQKSQNNERGADGVILPPLTMDGAGIEK